MTAAVQFRNFSKRYERFSLDNMNFTIEGGYITGLIGPNGSGKSTLIRSIMNLIRPDRGEVLVFNQSHRNRERDIKRKIGFVYDDDYFYGHLTVNEMRTVIASFYPTWNEALFQRYITDFAVPGRTKVRDLSKGMKTKFSLAAALAHEPELLIMDEPTSGLDPVFRREVLTIMSEFIQDGNRSVLFSTHICTDLERIADYIVYVREGKVLFSGTKEELQDAYVMVKGASGLLRNKDHRFVGLQQTALGFEGLMTRKQFLDSQFDGHVIAEKPSLDDILVYTREERA